MANFRPCLGRDTCVDTATTAPAPACRSPAEILRTSRLLDDLRTPVQDMDYENMKEFITCMGNELKKKVRTRRNGHVNGH